MLVSDSMRSQPSLFRRVLRSVVAAPGVLRACLLSAAGAVTLAGLFVVGALIHLDSPLLISSAIFNIISGITQMLSGAWMLLVGLLQASALLVLSLVGLLGVLALSSGLLRLLSRALPGFGTVWGALVQLLQAVLGQIAFQAPEPNGEVHAQARPEPRAAARSPRQPEAIASARRRTASSVPLRVAS